MFCHLEWPAIDRDWTWYSIGTVGGKSDLDRFESDLDRSESDLDRFERFESDLDGSESDQLEAKDDVMIVPEHVRHLLVIGFDALEVNLANSTKLFMVQAVKVAGKYQKSDQRRLTDVL